MTDGRFIRDVPATPVGTPLLRVDSLTKSYGPILAVAGLSLEVRSGEVFALLGPNGCGKSTTLGVILGYLRPTSGCVNVFDGAGWAAPRESVVRIGGLVEGPAFYPYLTGRENLRLLATARVLQQSTVEDALATAGLSDRADDQFGTYSLGMKQRLGVAAAILHSPHLVILDEPTNGLDPAGAREMRELIPRLAEGGRAVLLASHLLHEVEQICDQVAIMDAGKLVAGGTVDELLGVVQQVSITVGVDDYDRARSLLLSLPFVQSVEQGHDDLVVSLENSDATALNKCLAESGIFASKIRPATRSLETVFLRLTSPVKSADTSGPG